MKKLIRSIAPGLPVAMIMLSLMLSFYSCTQKSNVVWFGDFGNSLQAYFNWGDEPEQEISFDWAQLGINGKYRIRDVWRQKDLGEITDHFTASVPCRGVALVRMYPLR